MELWNGIICKILQSGNLNVSFSQMPDLDNLFANECYKMLVRIKNILEDNTLEDCDCFMKIEEIIIEFEKMGTNCGTRHDF